MSVKPKVLDVGEVIPPKRVPPAIKMVQELDGDYMIFTDLAEHIGVHVETLRRLCKAHNRDGSKKVKGPSKVVKLGDLLVYLFTPEDVREIEEHFMARGYVFERKGA